MIYRVTCKNTTQVNEDNLQDHDTKHQLRDQEVEN